MTRTIKPPKSKLVSKQRLNRTARIVEVRIHGAWSPSKTKESQRKSTPKPIRNPWIPTDVITLLKYVCTYGATKAMVELIKAWLDYRKAKKVQVRAAEYELTVEGAVSERVIESQINKFKTLIEGVSYDDIKVILPKGANRRLPPKRKPR